MLPEPNSPVARDRPAIACRRVTKSYRLYESALDQATDLLGMTRLIFWRPVAKKEFVALSGIDVSIERGERVAILGRNGAGKSTLLKIITGSSAPTSGRVELNGEIQALLQLGATFYPEFTGRENISAMLMHAGLGAAERAAAEHDILDFVELGDFVDRPVKTYSSGMKSRLQFACATAVRPDILAVDEILGAGDAYFSAKSAHRLETLAGSGCTLLMVSHSMSQLLQFCERAIWLEGGRIVADGPVRDIVNRYEKFIHEMRVRTGLENADQIADATRSEWLERRVIEALSASKPVPKNNPCAGETKVYRWRREDSPLEIVDTRTTQDGNDVGTIRHGSPMQIRITIRAKRPGSYPCRFAVLVFSERGEVLSRHISGWTTYDLAEGDTREAVLHYDHVLLGPGEYFWSTAAYERLDLEDLSTALWYDLHAASYAFTVLTGDGDSISRFSHPHRWAV